MRAPRNCVRRARRRPRKERRCDLSRRRPGISLPARRSDRERRAACDPALQFGRETRRSGAASRIKFYRRGKTGRVAPVDSQSDWRLKFVEEFAKYAAERRGGTRWADLPE